MSYGGREQPSRTAVEPARVGVRTRRVRGRLMARSALNASAASRPTRWVATTRLRFFPGKVAPGAWVLGSTSDETSADEGARCGQGGVLPGSRLVLAWARRTHVERNASGPSALLLACRSRPGKSLPYSPMTRSLKTARPMPRFTGSRRHLRCVFFERRFWRRILVGHASGTRSQPFPGCRRLVVAGRPGRALVSGRRVIGNSGTAEDLLHNGPYLPVRPWPLSRW